MAAKLAMSEDAIQRNVFSHIRSRGVPGLIALHPRNGAKDMRDPKVRAMMVARGVLPGASDVLLYYDGEFYALEIKSDVGHPTEEQEEFMAAVERQGGHAACHRGLKACIHQLERWALLRGSMA